MSSSTIQGVQQRGSIPTVRKSLLSLGSVDLGEDVDVLGGDATVLTSFKVAEVTGKVSFGHFLMRQWTYSVTADSLRGIRSSCLEDL